MTTDVAHPDVAQELHDWFRSVVRVADTSLFGMVPEGPHRDAVVLDILTRNARVLVDSEVDTEGRLYSPLCFFLAAACRRLRTSLGRGHWLAAVDNVVRLSEQMAVDSAASATLGLEIGGPARRFKQELDEAILHAGLGSPSYLDKESREIALGLAVNWGMRLLLAYALECGHSPADPGRQDLAWVASRLSPRLSVPASGTR